MALSASESALLTETCENMNVAANTCREVLEMLRNLGNTGVVDIADHNNAATPHANATNLFHVAPSGMAYLGQVGWTGVSDWANYYSLRFDIDSAHKGYDFGALKATNGTTTNSAIKMNWFVAATDSSGTLLSESECSVAGLNRNTEFGKWESHFNTADATRAAAIVALTGSFSEQTNPFSETCFRFNLSKHGTNSYAIVYEFNSQSILPWSGVTASIGASNFPFDTAYFRTAATTTSDRREKSGISAIGSEAVEFIKSLRPVQFTVKNGKQNVLEADENGYPTNIETVPGTRRHWGLIAQEVQEALVSAGYDPSACAVWSLADKDDPDSRQALRYEELIAPMIKVIQNQQERIDALERKVA